MPKDNFGNKSRFNEGVGKKKPFKQISDYKVPEVKRSLPTIEKKPQEVNKTMSTQMKKGVDVNKLSETPIKIGAQADMSLFNPINSYVFDDKYILSNSKNSIFKGSSLKGKIYGTISNGKMNLNE